MEKMLLVSQKITEMVHYYNLAHEVRGTELGTKKDISYFCQSPFLDIQFHINSYYVAVVIRDRITAQKILERHAHLDDVKLLLIPIIRTIEHFSNQDVVGGEIHD